MTKNKDKKPGKETSEEEVSGSADQLRDRLESLMRDRALSNAEVGRLIGVEGQTVGAWLKGTRNISRRHRDEIERLFKTTPEGETSLEVQVNRLITALQERTVSEEILAQSLASVLFAFSLAFYRIAPRDLSNFEVVAIGEFLSLLNGRGLSRILETVAEQIKQHSLPPNEFAEANCNYPSVAVGLEFKIEGDQMIAICPFGKPFDEVALSRIFLGTNFSIWSGREGAGFTPDVPSIIYGIKLSDPDLNAHVKHVTWRYLGAEMATNDSHIASNFDSIVQLMRNHYGSRPKR